MTNAEMSRPILLDGKVVSIPPGVFIFGLSDEPSARQQNLSSLRDLSWIALPFAYKSGLSGVLVMEKGADGEHVLDEALRSWGE
jgi:hypothetical protein